MKYTHSIILFVCIFFPGINFLYAQDSTQLCKVELPSLVGKYTGECKNGFANGKGEAWGLQHYVGLFKKGLPDGKGIYNYTDSMYYSGKFQDGIREGKGEMHYLRQGMPDSTIKGYWSADEFRGDKYITYKFEKHGEFENFQFRPSPESGNTVTIEIQTTTQNGQLVLSVRDHGIGISKEDQKHLMERFFRGANAGNIQGTGLGLHIVSKYAELMDATVECKSELEKGTKFILTFAPKEN